MEYYLGLGSNLGQREKNLLSALKKLKQFRISIQKVSSIYETQPFGDANQPWYMNMVVQVKTRLSPDQLFDKIKKIENDMGRTLHGVHHPRLIDIDILFLEDQVIHSNNLRIPHKELTYRNFVLVPLLEIAPDLIHPVFKEKISTLYKKCADESMVRKIKSDVSL
ncbi:MAG: 2-amino-4-hydroxy-6-hydroxymethyldihydropteridine diphosphokinase [Candidatus Aminicenantes bacterium]|nr:2-amino-4-hydroxy-6-hydroxymethyldihydropteridine diphosphokinase [Candidatus Aminicenantes bacterium]